MVLGLLGDFLLLLLFGVFLVFLRMATSQFNSLLIYISTVTVSSLAGY